MIPIVSIVGKSNSGKTTLIEKLLKELLRKGFKVATIKHDVHDFEMDVPGKDTWRHSKAGSSISVISSPRKVAFIRNVEREWGLDEIAADMTGVDLIITEGFKREGKLKVEVLRAERSKELLSSKEELIAVVADFPMDIGGIPWRHINDAAAISDIIIHRVLYGKERL